MTKVVGNYKYCFVTVLFFFLSIFTSPLPPPGGAAHILTMDEQGFLSHSLPPPFGGLVPLVAMTLFFLLFFFARMLSVLGGRGRM